MANVRDYTISDAIFQTIRIFIYVMICREVYNQWTYYHSSKVEIVAFSYQTCLVSVAIGTVIYLLLHQTFKTFMYSVFRCELLGSQDFTLVLDSPKNRHMILAMAFLEKFEYINMREHFNKKMKTIHKCRSQLVKFCGLLFFKELTEKEWEEKSKKVFVCVDDVTNEKALKEFMVKQQMIDDLTDIQYRMYFFPQMCGGRSACVLKTHHCFTDGLGLSTLWLAFSGDYDANNLPSLKSVPCCQQLILDLFSPFIFLYFLAGVMSLRADKNCIKNGAPVTGQKVGGYRYDFNITDMKKYCKANKVSINDHTAAILSQTIYDYMKEKGDKGAEVPRKINIAVPYSMRQPFKEIKDVRMVNDFASLPISIELHENYADALKHMKKLFNGLKSSLMPFGSIYSNVFQNNLPYNFAKYIMADNAKKFTLIYSNLNASKTLYYWDNKKLLGQFFFVPGCSEIQTGIGLCTTGNITSMTCFSDISEIEDPQWIVDRFYENNEKVVSQFIKQKSD